MGVVITDKGKVIEDGCWLRGINDVSHINLAELEAVIKGVNMAVSWNFKNIEIRSDLATVCMWLNSISFKNKRVKVNGLSEVLVKRRLELLSELISLCELEVTIGFVRSSENLADTLTRVPKHWLTKKPKEYSVIAESLTDSRVNSDQEKLLVAAHEKFHGGAEKTAFVANKLYPNKDFSLHEAKLIVKKCSKCLSIDPNPVQSLPTGDLECDKVWQRVAIDTTHFNDKKFLSIIDCGRHIWRPLKDETAECVSHELDAIFTILGPPDEIVLDNYPSFRSEVFIEFLRRWGISPHFRCVNKPSGNGICERNHRTIKKMAARSGNGILNAVYYYNSTPKSDGKIPSTYFFNRRCRFPDERPGLKTEKRYNYQSNYSVGDKVYTKPNNCKCTDVWTESVVTDVSNGLPIIEVNGTNYHESHVRKVPPEKLEEKQDTVNVANNDDWILVGPKGRPLRGKKEVDRFGVVKY